MKFQHGEGEDNAGSDANGDGDDGVAANAAGVAK